MRIRKKIFTGFCVFVYAFHVSCPNITFAGPQNGFHQNFATFLGGSDWDRVQSMVVDSNGFIYVTGTTDSNNFPTTPGAFQTTGSGGTFDNDGYVAKLSPDGRQLIWSTYLRGSGRDDIYGIRLDSAGNIVVAGWTLSTDFPITHGIGVYDETHNGNFDIFVTKLKPDGSGLIFSTFIGGTGKDQTRGAMVIEPSGAITFSGYTDSTDFPTKANSFQPSYKGGYGDAVVFKLSADGKNLLASTYLGSSGADSAFSGVGVHSDGSIIVTGWAGAADFPVSPGAYQTTFGGAGNGSPWSGDSFVARFSSDLTARIYATFLGGSLDDAVATQNGLVLDSAGNAIVSGRTDSVNFPVTPGAYQPTLKGHADFFVAKISLNGSQLLGSTYFGGPNDAGAYYEASGIRIDNGGNIYFSGQTSDPSYPVTLDAFQSIYGGGQDDIVLGVVSPTCTAALYSTFIGGSGHERGRTLWLDPTDESILIGGDTDSNNFPITAGVYQPNQAGGGDAYIFKFTPNSTPGNQAPTVAQAAAGNPNPVTGMTSNLSVLGADDSGETNLTYTWSTVGTPPAPVAFSVNGTNASKNSVVTFTKAGTYSLQARIQDAQGLFIDSPLNLVVNQTLTSITVSPVNSSVAVGGTVQFTATLRDQFNNVLTNSPVVQWSVNGGGSINSSGLFTAGMVPGGPFIVTAQSGNIQGTAQISVTASQPPIVTITSPADGTHFTAPATINIAASASDPDGMVTKVEFFSGNTKLGQDTTSPYAFQWTNVPVGSFVLMAKATDNSNGTGTSLPVTIVVDPVIPNNQPPVVDAGPDQNISFGGSASLNGIVSDDGLPNPPGVTTTLWSKVSGPGAITFGDINTLTTDVSFLQPGTYVIRLTASDGALAAFDTLQIDVDGGINPSGNNDGETRFIACMDPSVSSDRMNIPICINMSASGRGTLDVYSKSGKMVRRLRDDIFSAGLNTVFWDGKNELGDLVSSGIYMAVFKLEGGSELKSKVAVIR